MSRNYAPRDGLPKPFEGYPAYGAVHNVTVNDAYRSFLYEFCDIADEVFSADFETEIVDNTNIDSLDEASEFEPITIIPSLAEEETFSESEPEDVLEDFDMDIKRRRRPKPAAAKISPVYTPESYYKLFDIEKLGVSVVEMDPSANAARAIRTLWERQDFGQVQKEAKDQLMRHIPRTDLRLVFGGVMGVGRRMPNIPRADLRQKLALMPDPNAYPENLSLIQDEAEVVIDSIGKRLKQWMYPWDIIPHLTFAVFKRRAQPEQIIEIVQRTNEYVESNPVAMKLGELVFRYHGKR